MNEVLLISESTLKKYTLVNDNVDGCYILPAIQITQDIDLDTIIGPVLFNKLKQMVADDSILTNEDYKFLLDEYITPYLCWQTMAAIQLNINYKLSNSGVVQNQDQQKTSMQYENNRALQSQYEKYANAYGTKLRDFLLRNANKYPEYKKCENYERAEDQQLCDIYLPSDYERCKYIGK